MYVLGETNLERVRIHYSRTGEILPAVPGAPEATPEGSDGMIVWTLRPLSGGDRHIFSSKSDDEPNEDADRDALIALTVSIEGLAVKTDEGVQEITEATVENYDSIDAAILSRVMQRVTARMTKTYEDLGESGTPSDS